MSFVANIYQINLIKQAKTSLFISVKISQMVLKCIKVIYFRVVLLLLGVGLELEKK